MTDPDPQAVAIAVENAANDHTLLAVMHEWQVQMDKKADLILAQTLKTNGRVNDLESWRDKVQGAWVAVSLAGPIITGLVVGLVLKMA